MQHIYLHAHKLIRNRFKLIGNCSCARTTCVEALVYHNRSVEWINFPIVSEKQKYRTKKKYNEIVFVNIINKFVLLTKLLLLKLLCCIRTLSPENIISIIHVLGNLFVRELYLIWIILTDLMWVTDDHGASQRVKMIRIQTAERQIIGTIGTRVYPRQ